MLRLDLIHRIINKKFGGLTVETDGLLLVKGGQADVSPSLPYIQHNLIFQNRYKNYQKIPKEIKTTLNSVTTTYFNKVNSSYRYILIGDDNIDEDDEITQLAENALPSGGKDFQQLIEDVHAFLCTETFKSALEALRNDNNILLKYGHTIMSDIEEVNLNKNDFFERRLFFDIRYDWSDNFVEDETNIGVIEEVDPQPERVTAPVGL